MKKSNFTLLELILVIFVLISFAPCILGIIKQGVSKNQNIACANNLRNIGSFFSMYADEYNGYIAPNQDQAYSKSPIHATSYPLHFAIAGYISVNLLAEDKIEKSKTNIKVMFCPVAPPYSKNKEARRSYGSFTRRNINQMSLLNSPVPKQYRNKWKNSPQSFILAMDSVRQTSPVGWQTCVGVGSAKHESIGCRHDNRANAVLVDGHVQALNKAELTQKDNKGFFSYGGQFGADNPQFIVEQNKIKYHKRK